MLGKLKKNMGLSLIIFAFFFLFEPRYALIDPVPDLIGYIILCSALINLADINDHIYSASKAFRNAAILSILRIVSKIILERYFQDDEGTVGLLLFAFIFAALELWILIPGYKSLFEGLLSLGMFEGGEAVYRKNKENGRNASEKLYSLTLIFLIVKNILECIPEFTTLENNESYEFVVIMRILSCILIMPMSVVWLVKIVRYFILVKNDRPFIEALEKKFTEKSALNPEFFFYRTACVGLLIMIIASVLTVDLISDGVNILPDIFAYITLILSSLILRIYSKKWITVLFVSIMGALCSVSVLISENRFYERYSPEMVNKSLEAYNSFYFMLSLYILQSIIFLICVTAVIMFLYEIFKKHIANTAEHELYKNESERGMIIRMILTLISALLSVVSSVYRVISHTITKDIWIFTYSNAISAVTDIIFIASSVALLLFMTQEIKQNHNMSL